MSDDNTSQSENKRDLSRQNLIIRASITVLTVAGLLWKLNAGKEFSNSDIILVVIAVIPWLPEFVKSFKIGKDGVEVTTQDLQKVEEKANAAMDASLRGVVKSPIAPESPAAAGSHRKTAGSSKNNDPQKGKWGGSPTANNRLFSARIETIPDEQTFRRIVLRVESTDPAKPLTGKVTFHLHPTFNKQDFDQSVVDGVAETSLVSYGAFTAGAEADEGETKLELDLTTLDDGMDQFFKR